MRELILRINDEKNEGQKFNMRKELGKLQNEKEDLEEMDKLLQGIIYKRYKPNIDDGVLKNINPLEGIIPIKIK